MNLIIKTETRNFLVSVSRLKLKLILSGFTIQFLELEDGYFKADKGGTKNVLK